MSNTVIDQRTEAHDFVGVWPYLRQLVRTTLSLVNMGSGEIGLSYASTFNGVAGGSVQGGPIEVSGNKNIVVTNLPKVTFIISNYNKTALYASLHAKITVDFPQIGTETIYDKSLGGEYTSENGWTLALASLDKKIESQKDAIAK